MVDRKIDKIDRKINNIDRKINEIEKDRQKDYLEKLNVFDLFLMYTGSNILKIKININIKDFQIKNSKKNELLYSNNNPKQ